MLVGDPRHVPKVVREDRHDVERQVERGEPCQARSDVGPDEPVGVGLVMDEVADAPQAMAETGLDRPGRRIGVVQRRPADDAQDPGVGRPGLGHRIGVGEAVGGLDEDGAVDPGPRQLGHEVRRREASEDGVLGGRRPGIPAGGQVPDVLVRVDSPGRPIRHGCAASIACVRAVSWRIAIGSQQEVRDGRRAR